MGSASLSDSSDVATPTDTTGTSFSSTSSGITALRNGLGTDNTVGAPSTPSTFKLTDGMYVAIACIFGVVVADTKIGPLVSGLLTIGVIYQATLLIQGK